MRRFENPNEVIAKIVELIEYEYDFATYAHDKYAMDDKKFESEDVQNQYRLWSGGGLQATMSIREQVKRILKKAL